MKNNTCPNCGAAMILSGYRWHCDYCGIEVDDMGKMIVRADNPKIKVAVSKVAVDNRWALELYPEDVKKYAKLETCKRLADFLFENDCVDFEEMFDPVLAQQVYFGKFRYVDKGQKL